jgi:hypothetical protein
MSNIVSSWKSILRLRFSLRSVLFVATIVALAIVVVLQWQRLRLLEREVRVLRTDVGRLTIDDPSLPQAIQIRQIDREHYWRWRVYLPPSQSYRVFEYSGVLPSRVGKTDEAWLQELDNLVPGKLSRSSTFGGRPAEFTLEAAISEQENGWKFTTSAGGSSVYPFGSDWIPFGHSRIPTNAPIVFKPGQPIILLHLTKPKRTPSAGGGVLSELPSDPAEGIVLVLKP